MIDHKINVYECFIFHYTIKVEQCWKHKSGYSNIKGERKRKKLHNDANFYDYKFKLKI